MIDTLRNSVIAGMFIALGCMVNLKVGGYFGAFLFSFGLLSVVLYGVPLYTGKAGFCKTGEDVKRLPIILFGNIIGTSLLAVCAYFCFPDMAEKAQAIVHARVDAPIYTAFFASFLCGFVMTTIVRFARKQAETKIEEETKQEPRNFIVLLVGIPLFILSGYWHSIADAFYYVCSMDYSLSMLLVYPITVIGNYMGCNAFNLITRCSLFCDEA